MREAPPPPRALMDGIRTRTDRRNAARARRADPKCPGPGDGSVQHPPGKADSSSPETTRGRQSSHTTPADATGPAARRTRPEGGSSTPACAHKRPPVRNHFVALRGGHPGHRLGKRRAAQGPPSVDAHAMDGARRCMSPGGGTVPSNSSACSKCTCRAWDLDTNAEECNASRRSLTSLSHCCCDSNNSCCRATCARNLGCAVSGALTSRTKQ